jgi:hypothetical protein
MLQTLIIFSPAYISFYLSHFFICPILPDFRPFGPLFFVLFPTSSFISFSLSLFILLSLRTLFTESISYLLIYIFSTFFHPVFFLHFCKLLNTFKLYFFIKENQNIGRTEKVQIAFEF